MSTKTQTLSTEAILQQPLDVSFEPLFIPVSKLDADQYMAQDLDGVTESLFGSGNLNFLILQSHQTDAALSLLNSFNTQENASIGSVMIGAPGAALKATDFYNRQNFDPSKTDIGTQKLAENASSIKESNNLNAKQESSLSKSAFDVSENNTNRETVQIAHGSNGYNGKNGVSATAVNGTNGTNGTSGSNGTDGHNGDGTTIIDNTTTINIDPPDVIIDISNLINIDDITNLITTTISEVTNLIQNLNITEIVNNVTSIVNNILNTLGGDGGLALHLDAILAPVTDLNLDLIQGETVTNLINQLIDLSPVTDLLEPVIDLDNLVIADLHSFIGLLGETAEHRPGDTDLGLGLEGTLSDLPILDAVVDLAFDPVENLLGDIDVLADLGLDLFNNENTDNTQGDTDLVGNIDLDLVGGDVLNTDLDVNLDIVESILGDIDLDLGIANNLLGDVADPVVDNLTGGDNALPLLSDIGDLAGDIVGDILPFNNSPDQDTDLSVDLGIDILDTSLAAANPDILLDPVEDLVGDIDLQITPELDLLGTNETSNDLGDHDLQLNSGIEIADQALENLDLNLNLDPVEQITGDIDLDINLGVDLLGETADNIVDNLPGGSGEDTLLSEVGDQLGDLAGGLLGDALPEYNLELDLLNGDAPQQNDTDIVIDFIEIPVDPIESLVGDIDLDLGIGNIIELLSPPAEQMPATPQAGGLTDIVNNLPDILSWPETTIPASSDTAYNTGNTSGLGALLPEPVTGIAEGLGLLDLHHNSHGGGGLLGGHGGFGGLFG